MLVFGTRPEAIKMAPLVKEFQKHPSDFETVVCVTGQHREMLDQVLHIFDIRPDYDLNIMKQGQDLYDVTARVLTGMRDVLKENRPDVVLVHGDTTTSTAAALAAFYQQIPVGHVEAGLRSFNMDMPEEINRILTDRISDILFCPTETAVNNLKKEGYENINCRIIRNGDVMQDAALFYAGRAVRPKADIPEDFVLCSVHRAENTDDPERLRNIFSALEEISKTCRVVLPLHPRTKGKLSAIGYDTNNSHILFIEPVGYLEMVWMLKHCRLVMTDSGGLQKEAYFFDKYCITLRDETEWVELVKYGYNFLAGDDKGKIISLYNHISDKNNIEQKTPLYGNGNAGDLIVETLRNY